MIPITAQEPQSTRYHPRVDGAFMVKLQCGGRALLVKAADVSMAGMRVRGTFGNVGARVTVALPLPGDREIVTGATVRRHGDRELALEFDQLDWDDLFALARYLNPRLP